MKKCPKCNRTFQSLGYARHRASCKVVPTPNKEKWEECDGLEAVCDVCKSGIKIAIRNALASQKREIVEKLKGMKKYDENSEQLGSGAYEYHARNELIEYIIKSLTEQNG